MLITGGTGTFGRYFVQRLLMNKTHERICIYSRSESTQAEMRAQFNNDKRLRFFVGDIRDQDRLTAAMKGVGMVVHAAALKRIEVGNYCPDEMVKTNILGTMNVIQACRNSGVAEAVFLSTDKAFQPVSAYGFSKAMAESLWKAAGIQDRETIRFATVRYGNVAGSTGSVIPYWRMLENLESKEWPITDPNCTRFWMTPADAVQLVYAAFMTKSADMFIPQLKAYKLGDLAEAMDCPGLKKTGLPSWEKRHECMDKANCSNKAERMTVEELRDALKLI